MIFETWLIPKNILDETTLTLTKGSHEIFVIWTSSLKATGPICEIRRCIVPAQQPGATLHGVYVHISGQELNRIQFDNFEKNERSIIQIHTHPSNDVQMSALDKSWEVVNHIGALSIIVPVYGKKGLYGFPGVNVYEREKNGWRLWTFDEIKKRLQVIS
ncbi:MAG: hypothetical protein HYV24_06680 [Deltaproteobacteria bacterium]|nr:hypothetical protein [Deltaproteobacteria bacterium]